MYRYIFNRVKKIIPRISDTELIALRSGTTSLDREIYSGSVNLNNIQSTVTEVRVSASGEVEKDGAILQTGGIHEPEFFQMFFTNIENSLVPREQ